MKDKYVCTLLQKVMLIATSLIKKSISLCHRNYSADNINEDESNESHANNDTNDTYEAKTTNNQEISTIKRNHSKT